MPITAGVLALSLSLVASVFAFRQYVAEVGAHKASRLADAGRFAEGEVEARAAIKANRWNGYALYQGGTAAYRKQSFHSALQFLDKSMDIMPHMANSLRIRGLSLFFLQDYEKAASLLDRYLRLVPQPTITPEFIIRTAALSFFSSGQLGTANYYLTIASDSKTTRGEIYRVRAVSHLLSNLTESAEFAYRSFRTLAPEGVLDPLEIVNNAIEAGKLEQTKEFLQRLHDEHPDDSSVIKALAATYNRLKRLPDAEKLLNQSVRRKPDDAELQLMYGDVLFAGRKHPEAFAAYDAHLKLKPDSAFRQEILRKKANVRP